MITIVIYGVIAIALASAAGYAFVTFGSSSRQLTQLQENQVRMDTATAALRASLLALTADGVLYAPMGSTNASVKYTQLPSWLGVVSASPWGQPYEYCPLSEMSATGLATAGVNILNTSGNISYSGTAYASAMTQGNSYLITTPTNSIPNSTGYLGFIVSSLGPGQIMPDCSAITVNGAGTGVSVAGGSVRSISAGFSFQQRVAASSDRMEIYVNTAATGNGTGSDAANAMTSLDSAFSLWQALQPRLTIIYLQPGNYSGITNTLSGEAQNNTGGHYDAQGENSSLIIETTPSQVSNNNMTNVAGVQFKNPLALTSATTFQNLNIRITNPGANSPMITAYKPLTLRNANIGPNAGWGLVNLYNTSLTSVDSLSSTTVFNAMNSTLEFLNQTTTVPTAATIGAITASGSHISFDNLVSSQSYWLNTAPSGYAMQLSGSTLNIGNALVGGSTTLSSGPISLNASLMSVSSTALLKLTGTGISSVQALNGSSVSIEGVVTSAQSTANIANIAVTGSTIGIDGTYTASNSAVAGTAIQAREGTVVGSGVINAGGSPTTFSCINISYPGPNYGTVIHIPKGNPPGNFGATSLDSPGFSQAKYGMPLMLAYALASDNSFDTTVAARLIQSQTAQTYPNMIDPYVPLTNALYVPGNYPLEPTNFEAAVRGITNQEYLSGLHINFTGTCN